MSGIWDRKISTNSFHRLNRHELNFEKFTQMETFIEDETFEIPADNSK